MTQESRSLTHGRSQGRGSHLLESSRVHTSGCPIEPNTDTLGEEEALINWRSPSPRVARAPSGISCSHSRYFRVAPCRKLEARTLNWIEPFSTGGSPSRFLRGSPVLLVLKVRGKGVRQPDHMSKKLTWGWIRVQPESSGQTLCFQRTRFETRQLRPYLMSLFTRVRVMAIPLKLAPGNRGAS